MSKLNKALITALKKHSNRELVCLKKDFAYERYSYKQIYDYSLKFISLAIELVGCIISRTDLSIEPAYVKEETSLNSLRLCTLSLYENKQGFPF